MPGHLQPVPFKDLGSVLLSMSPFIPLPGVKQGGNEWNCNIHFLKNFVIKQNFKKSNLHLKRI